MPNRSRLLEEQDAEPFEPEAVEEPEPVVMTAPLLMGSLRELFSEPKRWAKGDMALKATPDTSLPERRAVLGGQPRLGRRDGVLAPGGPARLRADHARGGNRAGGRLHPRGGRCLVDSGLCRHAGSPRRSRTSTTC